MSKNYMPEVAKMLGVELGEEFRIKYDTNCDIGILDGKFYLTEKGCCHQGGTVSPKKLQSLITGATEIVKLPWKPKNGDDYYFVYPDGSIYCCHFCYTGPTDLAMLYMGNCFHTKADAEAHRDEIMAKFREVMESEGQS